MEDMRRLSWELARPITGAFATGGRAISCRAQRERRIEELGEEGTMRRISHWHRTLVVLAVGLLALAAPLVAYADGGGPGSG